MNQEWASLHCVKSARVLEGCGQEMGLLSQWRRPCSVTQDPRTDTPWGTDVDETPEKFTVEFIEKRTCKLVEYYGVRNCPKPQCILREKIPGDAVLDGFPGQGYV